MTTRPKLVALQALLQAEQRMILMQAAEAGTIPSAGALTRIAELEATILAVEAMVEEEE